MGEEGDVGIKWKVYEEVTKKNGISNQVSRSRYGKIRRGENIYR